MSCAGHDQQMLVARCTVRIVFAAHVAGDKAVIPAVDQQHRNVTMRQRVCDRGGLQIETAEQFPAQADQLIDRENGQMLVADDLANDRGGRAVPAVGHNADDIAREIQSAGHQHGRCAHGHAIQQDLRVLAEAPDGVIHPRAAVIALLNAKREAPALALPMRALIDQQHVTAALHGDLRPAAEVPLRAAFVAVHHDLYRRTRPPCVVFSVQTQPVVGSGPDVLIRERKHGPDHLRHRFPMRGILLRVRQAEKIFFCLFWDEKAEPAAHIRRGDDEQDKDAENKQDDHGVFLRAFV